MKNRIASLRSGAVAAALLVAAWGIHAADALRPEVGKPLQAAQQLLKSQRYQDALAKLREADAVGGKSAAETLTIERMRLAVASAAGEIRTVSEAFGKIEASGGLSGADQTRAIESLAIGAYRARDYAAARQWAQRYVKDGGDSPSVRTVLVQSAYQAGDYAAVVREVRAGIQATEKAGGTPTEDSIKLLLAAASKTSDDASYLFGVEKLLSYHPKKQYWGELLAKLQSRPQFRDRFALETYRLALATDNLSRADDYVEFAQLAAQAGYPLEGKQVVDKGFAAGVLGTGADAARHQRLRDLLARRSQEDRAAWSQVEADARHASDGSALVKLGFNIVVAGDVSKGVSLMQEGIQKAPQQAAEAGKLRLGIALVLSGDKAKGKAALKGVSGNDGAAELARLWTLYARDKSGSA
jgi:hypothetical protein